ncbi:MAG: hypothetical protein B2I17_00100 [Thermoplasmatales archaeon B_DKE]|nr:MAG: hypothetical protein B2I17_00100 [Thermoplasmatales archaeon B_DKE]
MNKEEAWNWIYENLSKISSYKDDVFSWLKNSLMYEGKYLDEIDGFTTLLFKASIDARDQLITVLPDNLDARSALILSAILILKWVDYSKLSNRGRKVLYFDTKVGIRQRLSKTKLGGSKINFDDLFPQIHLSERKSIKSEYEDDDIWDVYLPIVVCSYSPVDPKQTIRGYSPDWIAVNCGDAPKIEWLEPLFQYALEEKIPAVAWTSNPFFEGLQRLREHEFPIFNWPNSFFKNGNVHDKFSEIHGVKPLFIKGAIESILLSAHRNLMRASRIAESRLSKDACLIGWNLLRSMEVLSVPSSIYEAEVYSHWGLKSINSLSTAFSHFTDILEDEDPNFYIILKEIRSSLIEFKDYLDTSPPPFWHALLEIIEKSRNSHIRTDIIFPSKGRKDIFFRALLARKNFSDEDLENYGIRILSLKQYRENRGRFEVSSVNLTDGKLTYQEGLKNQRILVGFPSITLTPNLDTILLEDSLSILLYNFQDSALSKQIIKWNELLNPKLQKNLEVVKRYINTDLPEVEDIENTGQIIKVDPEYIEIPDSSFVSNRNAETMVFEPIDPIDEIEAILRYQEGEDTEQQYIEKAIPTLDYQDNGELWVEEALEVHFNDGWKCLFASDDKAQVLFETPNGRDKDLRYVRSLKIGDEVLFIYGENRKSLYDLMISRIHGIPAIETHLSMILRWQEDFVKALRIKSVTLEYKGFNTFEKLLVKMVGRGSQITSVQTFQVWFKGQVIAPEDPEDLRRLAEELDMKFVYRNYHAINAAARRIRDLHRKLSLALNKWLVESSVNIVENNIDIYKSIDDKLGLTLQDFKDSIMVLRVNSIKVLGGPFYKDSLGKLEKEVGF